MIRFLLEPPRVKKAISYQLFRRHSRPMRDRQLLHLISKLGTVVSIAFLAALEFSLNAEDWPQWRGNQRDGVWHETGILKSFPAEGLKISWRAPVGYGFSSPVVAKGRVYITDLLLLDQPKGRARIQCFEESNSS